MGRGGIRWKISFRRSSASAANEARVQKKPPSEFVCPISGALMADPVIVPSGQTFERACAEACRDLGFAPLLPDGSRPDISTTIPNQALRSTILKWCDQSAFPLPSCIQAGAAEVLVRGLMMAEERNEMEISQKGIDEEREKELLLKGVSENPQRKMSYAATEVNPRHKQLYCSSSEESSSLTTPLPLTTKPFCYSSSSSSPSSAIEDNFKQMEGEKDEEDEKIVAKLTSPLISEQEECVTRLRNISKSFPEKRALLCNQRLLLALRPLLGSRHASVQTNAVAVIVNLSLEKPNKVKIVRAGTVPLLIEALRSGHPEAQEHAAGAIFSLSLDDENKIAIGVLGVLPPLLHMLLSSTNRGCRDAALALYNLSLSQSNRSKLVKLGAVPTLLALASRDGEMAGRVLIILCNIASSAEGKVALLDGNAVQVFVDMLNKRDVENSVRENCISALFTLSQCGLRFKGAAKAAGAVEVLFRLRDGGSERARQKVNRILMTMRGEEEEGGGIIGRDEGDGAKDLGVYSQQRYQVHKTNNITG